MGSTLSQTLQRVSRTDPEPPVGQAGMPRQIVAPSTKNQRLTVSRAFRQNAATWTPPNSTAPPQPLKDCNRRGAPVSRRG